MIDNPSSRFGAGVIYATSDGRVLLLLRSEDSDNPGTWCWPGGTIEPGEDPEQAAKRESKEEIGYYPNDLRLFEEHEGFVTFKSGTNIEIPVTLNDEHTEYMWVEPLVAANSMSLHPGVRGTILRHYSRLSTRFYVQERLGPRRSITSEGFMLCENVPIARSGTMLYASHELPGVTPDNQGIIRVDRSPSEILAPHAIASFAGKDVTIGHPPGGVDATNWKKHSVGEVHNPRPGEGEFTDCIVADLLVKDPRAIKLINDGQDEVSCGYDADYKMLSPGHAQQLNILGNHIALVKSGRCGPRCSIGDSQMPKMSFTERLRAKFLKTADEFVAEFEKEGKTEDEAIATDVVETPTKDEETCNEPTKDEGGSVDLSEVLRRLQVLEDTVTSLSETVSKIVSAEKAEAERTMANDESEVDAPEGGTATNDEDILDDGEVEDGANSRMTKDSSAILDTRSRCEILAPGLKFMTFDNSMAADKVADGLCVMRRRALAAAIDGPDKSIIAPLLPGGKASVRSMTCDAAAAIFVGASELMKVERKRRGAAGVKVPIPRRTNDHGGVNMATDAIAEINRANRDFWANKR